MACNTYLSPKFCQALLAPADRMFGFLKASSYRSPAVSVASGVAKLFNGKHLFCGRLSQRQPGSFHRQWNTRCDSCLLEPCIDRDGPTIFRNRMAWDFRPASESARQFVDDLSFVRQYRSLCLPRV